MSTTVYVALSGGVDSTTAALLLQQQGYAVEGITIDTGYGNAVAKAADCCQRLNIAHHVIDGKELFRQNVVDYFVDAYLHGLTPNPCVICNQKIKFALIYELISEDRSKLIATGHYVKKIASGGRFLLAKAASSAKDQSYFLYKLPQKILERCLFPLGEYQKSEVRQIAAAASMPVATEHDSQDICFIPDGNYRGILEQTAGKRLMDGDIIDTSGNLIGRHHGLANYTVGQRKGLGVSSQHPLYVVAIDDITNKLIVGREDKLYSKEAICNDCNFLAFTKLTTPLEVDVKIRYLANPVKAEIIPENDFVKIIFNHPQRAVTPGQAAVFYQGDILIGGGTIL